MPTEIERSDCRHLWTMSQGGQSLSRMPAFLPQATDAFWSVGSTPSSW